MTRLYQYNVHLETDEQGRYTVTVPVLPGLVTWGENLDLALASAREAIEAHVATLRELGKAIPEDHSESFPSAFSVRLEVPLAIA